MDQLCFLDHFIEVKKLPGTVRMIIATLLAIFLLSTAYCQEKHSILVHDDKHCPPWLYYNDTIDQCSCYQSSSRDVECRESEREALLRFGRCMTYEEGSGTASILLLITFLKILQSDITLVYQTVCKI